MKRLAKRSHPQHSRSSSRSARIVLAPSILSADIGALRAEMQQVVAYGADWLHVDVMDGSFVPPITFGANVVALARAATKVPIDVHLMIREPERHLRQFAEAGSNHITIHQEACVHLHRTLDAIHHLKCKAGVAINPATPVQAVFEVLDLVDIVLIMTVNPGWGGQKFIRSTLPKIALLRDECARRSLSPRIVVDGGIDSKTARLCTTAGASVLVAGSSIFSKANRQRAIQSLRESVA
ncbi:MAG: ribulose-phosphate 3-epimerase [Bdellovibrionota bacterium]|nr:MAG: ribulose-phosphate 3-epimerase [Bdellovibrionota bacterium]